MLCVGERPKVSVGAKSWGIMEGCKFFGEQKGHFFQQHIRIGLSKIRKRVGKFELIYLNFI